MLVLKPDQIIVNVSENEPLVLYYRLQALKRVLPKVIIKGIQTVTRAVISEMTGDKKQLLVEGYGLQEVMTTEGEFVFG